jgi:hypothetical protein
MNHAIFESAESRTVIEASCHEKLLKNRWGLFKFKSDIGVVDVVEVGDGWEEYTSCVQKLSSTCRITDTQFGPNFAIFAVTTTSPPVDINQTIVYESDAGIRDVWEIGFSNLAPGSLPGAVSVTKIASGIRIQKLSVGEWHCMVLTKTGDVFCCGRGSSGELGIGGKVPWQNTFEKINGLDECVDIAAGSHFSVAVTSNGGVYTFGCGAYYRLGHGSDDDVLYPKQVSELEGIHIESCSCGAWHTVVVASGTRDIFGFGWNKYRQLGSTSEEIVLYPVRIKDLDRYLDDSGESILDVACSLRNSCVLVSDGRAYVLGCAGSELSSSPLRPIFGRGGSSSSLSNSDSHIKQIVPVPVNEEYRTSILNIFSCYHDGSICLLFENCKIA